MPAELNAPLWLGDRYGRPALLAGIVGFIVMIVGWFLAADQFYRAYLVGMVLWVGVSLGCMALLMVNHLSAGKWGLVSRRVMEAGSRLFPLLFVLFIPIAIGMWTGKLYQWVPSRLGELPWELQTIIRHKQQFPFHVAYMTPISWLVRIPIYFGIWWLMSSTLSRWSLERDADPVGQDWQRKFENLSGPGVVVYAMTMTFAMLDWVMALDATWYSTIYELIFLAGQGMAALCVILYTVITISEEDPLRTMLRKTELHDLGKLVLAFIMLFAYFSFSQWVIIWSGNLPDEIGWYLHRVEGPWRWISAALVILQFALPFCLMLSRRFKRSPAFMLKFSVYLLIVRWLQIIWEVEPNFPNAQGANLHFHLSQLLYIAAPVAIGGIWVWAFVRELRSRPVFPAYDPQMSEILEPEHATA